MAVPLGMAQSWLYHSQITVDCLVGCEPGTFWLFLEYLKVRLSPSNKNVLFASMIAFQRWWKNAFSFISKALFVLKIFKSLSWLFGHVEKMVWSER